MNDTRSMHLRCLSATMLFRARTGARAVPAPRIFDAWALKVRRRNLQVRAYQRVVMSCERLGQTKDGRCQPPAVQLTRICMHGSPECSGAAHPGEDSLPSEPAPVCHNCRYMA